jgi:hypothetical protein
MSQKHAPTLGNGVKFAVVFCVVNLHTLRGLSALGYLAVYIPVAIYVFAQYVSRNKNGILSDCGSLFRLWALLGFLAYFVSLQIISTSGAATGLIRFLFATPIFMALTLYTNDISDLLKHIRTMVTFFALASLTLPMQFVTGPVSWFPDASTRAGFERYSSLVGSLTSIGVIVGCYLLLVQLLPGASRYIWLCLIALPAVSSLSKSAIANAALGVSMVIWLNRRSLPKLVALVAVSLLTGLFVVHQVPIVSERLSATLSSFGLDKGSLAIANYDSTAGASAWERVTSLPLANMDALHDLHSPLVYAVGGGFGMANTALVPKGDITAPMAHNQFAESFSVFGMIGVGLQIFIMAAIAFKLHKRYRADAGHLYLIILSTYGLFLVNSIFANGTIYQPASASIFFLSMFAATSEVAGLRHPDQSSTPTKA